MSMEAVALVRIRASVLAGSLQAAGPSGTTLVGVNGEALDIEALDDATLVFTSVSMRETEPDELGLVIRALLGDALDQHDDERGVLVFPKAAAPASRTYDEAVAEVGEMGEWAPHASAEDLADDESGGFAALAGDLMDTLGPEVLELQQRMMAGDPSAMQDAMAQVGAMLADPSKQEALMKAVAAFTGKDSPLGDIGDIASKLPPGITNPADLMKNMDLGALSEQAKKMMAENPNLEKELQERLHKKAKKDE